MVHIVLTHGRGLPARDTIELRNRFVSYLRDGLERAGYLRLDEHDVGFVYYGDLLQPPLMEADTQPSLPEATSDRRLAFEDDVDALCRHLVQAGATNTQVCRLVEERASRTPTISEDAAVSDRRGAVETAVEERTAQLLDDPRQLRSVLDRRFGSGFGDDDVVKQEVQALRTRLGTDPRDAAARRAAGEMGTDEPDRIDAVLREWIIDPVTDAVAGLQALGRVLREYGVDLRRRLSDWQQAIVQEMLDHLGESDLARHAATVFDIILVIANNSMLDGLFIMLQLEDVESYFRQADIRSDIRSLFRTTLQRHGEPAILVAHSFGSVVVYDVLREHPELDVSGLVTLGSPLPIDFLRDQLARSGESADDLPVPAMLDGWVNVYSEIDAITLGSGIARYFQGGEDGRGPVDRVVDDAGLLSAHDPDQYIGASVTAEAIISMIGVAAIRNST